MNQSTFKINLLTFQNVSPVSSDFSFSFNISEYNKNKMNCELMHTYDTPAYMFNVYKNQLSRQTGSRNLTGPKTLLTIWHTYILLRTKYVPSLVKIH